VASEWAPQSGMWAQFTLAAVNSNGTSGWQQSNATDPLSAQYPGSWDPNVWGNNTRTLTWDLSKYNSTGASWLQIVFSTNMGNVTTAGNYYIDNVRLLSEVQGTLSVDDFSAAVDYIVDELGSYDGILDVNHLVALNANVSTPGALFMQTSGASWDPGPGPMLYKEVSGDFVATVKVVAFGGTLASPLLHNDAGLLARDSNGAAENWVSVNYFPTWTGFVARSTAASQRSEMGQPAGRWTGADTYALAAEYPYLQLERKGSDFYPRISKDGVNFIPLTLEAYTGIYNGTQTPLVISRPDLPKKLQIGLINATYDVTTGDVTFDDFKITTP
jgi:hypothetical protein